MKIYIHYNITNNPYGGANSFLKALISEVSRSPKVRILNKFKEKPDIFLYNSFSTGRGRIKVGTIKNVFRLGYPNILQFFVGGLTRRKVFLIHRVDGIAQLYGRMNKEEDDLQLLLNRYADHTIFQSRFCLESFKAYGYSSEKHSIICNGVNQKLFNLNGKVYWDGRSKVKVFSSSWSKNPKKGHEIIAKVSEFDFVETYFVGNWPEGVDMKRVRVLPPMHQEELAREYRKYDVFFHPAENDPCPNSVLEALSCGLPVLYRNSGGTPEIVGEKYGTSIDDKDLKSVFDLVTRRYNYWVDDINKDYSNFSISQAAEKYINTFLRARDCR